MKKIILDTNFLMIPFQFKVDIISEIDRICDVKYSLCIIDLTLKELKGIVEKQKGRNKDAAKLALKLIALKGFRLIKSGKVKDADSAILEIATKDHVVCTQDMNLKRKLREKGIRIITLRSRKHLVIS